MREKITSSTTSTAVQFIDSYFSQFFPQKLIYSKLTHSKYRRHSQQLFHIFETSLTFLLLRFCHFLFFLLLSFFRKSLHKEDTCEMIMLHQSMYCTSTMAKKCRLQFGADINLSTNLHKVQVPIFLITAHATVPVSCFETVYEK